MRTALAKTTAKITMCTVTLFTVFLTLCKQTYWYKENFAQPYFSWSRGLNLAPKPSQDSYLRMTSIRAEKTVSEQFSTIDFKAFDSLFESVPLLMSYGKYRDVKSFTIDYVLIFMVINIQEIYIFFSPGISRFCQNQQSGIYQ